MDLINQLDSFAMPQVAVYVALSFIIVTLLGIIIYLTCGKKYRLNWFEKNLLESAKEREHLRQRYLDRIM